MLEFYETQYLFLIIIKEFTVLLYRDKNIWLITDLALIEKCLWWRCWHSWSHDCCWRSLVTLEFPNNGNRW